MGKDRLDLWQLSYKSAPSLVPALGMQCKQVGVAHPNITTGMMTGRYVNRMICFRGRWWESVWGSDVFKKVTLHDRTADNSST